MIYKFVNRHQLKSEQVTMICRNQTSHFPFDSGQNGLHSEVAFAHKIQKAELGTARISIQFTLSFMRPLKYRYSLDTHPIQQIFIEYLFVPDISRCWGYKENYRTPPSIIL